MSIVSKSRELEIFFLNDLKTLKTTEEAREEFPVAWTSMASLFGFSPATARACGPSSPAGDHCCLSEISTRLGPSRGDVSPCVAPHSSPSSRLSDEKSKLAPAPPRCSRFSISLSRTSTAPRPCAVRIASRGVFPARAGSGWSGQPA